MKVILVSVGNFQEYMIDNIRNLKLFGNNDITVITEDRFFDRLRDLDVTLVGTQDLGDLGFGEKSRLDRQFRQGFWHFCSLRFFYIYSYMAREKLRDCIHLENDVMAYINFENLRTKLSDRSVSVTRDNDLRVIPGIVSIPSAEALRPLVENYNFELNDMENLSRFNFECLPIFPDVGPQHRITAGYKNFECIFDAAAMGQYLGGVDPNNAVADTRGFVNETCIIDYSKYEFFWIKMGELFVPHVKIDNDLVRIVNLHIHCKDLSKFTADSPKETRFISQSRETSIIPTYNNKVKLSSEYFSKWERLPACPVKAYNYSWANYDFPRNWAIMDFDEWTKKYGITKTGHLGCTDINDPEIEFLKWDRRTAISFPPYDLHTISCNFKNEFDFFVFNQTLEHLYDPFEAMRNIWKTVKPGGYVFTSVPTINIPHMTPVHFNGFTPMGLAMLFQTTGYDIIEIGQWGNFEYIQRLFFSHSWPGYRDLHKNGLVTNEERNVCQCWILARKPI